MAELIRDYSRMGDVGVIALCCLVFILLTCSYVSRTRSYRIFSAIVGFVFLAAIINIGYHELYRKPEIAQQAEIAKIGRAHV